MIENFDDGSDCILDQNEYACKITANNNRHTIEESELCDDGSVGCKDCPFIKS